MKVALLAVALAALSGACCSAPKPAEPVTTTAPVTPDPQPDPGAEVPLGEACGGIAPRHCAATAFCDVPEHCGAADQSGVCTAKPEMCTRDYRPVCGCDGKTYGNRCTAHSAGVSVQAEGECPLPPPG